MAKEELSKGIRNDSLVFNVRFGDTRDEFFGKCYDLNKQHLVTQGPKGNAVQYLFVDSLVHRQPEEIRMLFAPHFDKNDKISELQIELSYTAWAPWNKQYQSDSLMDKSLLLLKKWYGGNDFVIANINELKIPAKIDGNRRILVNKKDAQSIKVRIQDLLNPEFQHSVTRDAEGK